MNADRDEYSEHSIRYDWPPELLHLLIEVIPRLHKGKDAVITFFRGAGVSGELLNDLVDKLSEDRSKLNKFQIARTVLKRLLERGDATIGQRREIIQRVVQHEDYSTCYPDDQLEAKGLVANIRELVNERDTFTRIVQERERELEQHKAEYRKKIEAQRKVRSEREAIKSELYALFSVTDASKRGKALEGILNRLFESYGVLVTEAFTISGEHAEGIIEQIDGVISLDGELYLVEMKWWQTKLGPGDVSQHLVRVFNRGQARGILISNSGYTDAALQTCKDSLHRSVFVLCTLDEMVTLLETEFDLREMLRQKIHASVLRRTPYFKVNVEN